MGVVLTCAVGHQSTHAEACKFDVRYSRASSGGSRGEGGEVVPSPWPRVFFLVLEVKCTHVMIIFLVPRLEKSIT